jgi:hypothetical protein
MGWEIASIACALLVSWQQVLGSWVARDIWRWVKHGVTTNENKQQGWSRQHGQTPVGSKK